MFEYLAKFNKIFVTGPQRSGTRICAKMVAHDTGHEFVDETQINMDSFYNFSSFLKSKRKCVIQCPTLCRYIHFFASKDSAVVLLRRNAEDIIESQKRIKWNNEWLELIRYDRREGIISEIKYDFWKNHQKKQIENAYEIGYDSLKAHSLWISKQDRKYFVPYQTVKIISVILLPENVMLQKAPEVELFVNANRSRGILVSKNNTFNLINKTGLQIWKMCDGSHSKKDISNQLTHLFPEIKSKMLIKESDRFIEELYGNHFITFYSKT